MRWIFLLLSSVALAACGSAFSDSDGEGGAGGGGAIVGNGGGFPSGGQSNGGTGGGSAGAAGAPVGGTDAGGNCSHIEFNPTADTGVYPAMECSNWDWSINSGSATILPIGGVQADASRAFLRFELGADTYQKLLNPGSSMKLVLTRVPGGSDCGAQCPFNPGKIQAFPLRVDWTEGDGGNNTGANWCFGGANETEPWAQGGAAAAQDSGALVGSADVMAGATSVSIPLAVAPFADWADTNLGRFSVLLTPTAGVKYFFASREHDELPIPVLAITLCDP